MVLLSITVILIFQSYRNMDSEILQICEYYALVMDGCNL